MPTGSPCTSSICSAPPSASRAFCLFAQRRWVLSFIAFWCAYKAKELAVMLPAVLFVYEYWLGRAPFARAHTFLRRIPVIRPAGHSAESEQRQRIHFPFYACRAAEDRSVLCAAFPFLALQRIRASRAGARARSPRLVRTGRFLLFLSLCCFFQEGCSKPILICRSPAPRSRSPPPHRMCGQPGPGWRSRSGCHGTSRDLRHERNAKLALDDEDAAYVDQLQQWVSKHPAVTTSFIPDFRAATITGASPPPGISPTHGWTPRYLRRLARRRRRPWLHNRSLSARGPGTANPARWRFRYTYRSRNENSHICVGS